MAFDLTGARIVNMLGGLALFALGLWIARVRPRRRENLALAGFVGFFGFARALRNLDDSFGQPPPVPTEYFQEPLEFLAALMLVYVAVRLPRPAVAMRPRLLFLPAAAAGLYMAGAIAARLADPVPPDPTYDTLVPPLLSFVVGSTSQALGNAVLVLLPLRFMASPPGASRDRAQIALMAGALMVWYSGLLGISLWGFLGRGEGEVSVPWFTADAVTSVLLPAALWLLATHRARGVGQAAWARNAALVAVGAPAAIFFAAVLAPTSLVGGLLGVARVGMAVMFAYAILSHQLLGLDVKVKWTLKQGTIAAAFIGVFFVVSESASTFFAASGLGSYLGIAAAGLLVFAMAPLQRAAERVASAVMPGVKGVAEMDEGERGSFYREQLALAWADGVLGEAERVMLEAQRRRLGLSLERARDLEREVVRERIAAGGRRS